jgi:hypothetical protein
LGLDLSQQGPLVRAPSSPHFGVIGSDFHRFALDKPRFLPFSYTS